MATVGGQRQDFADELRPGFATPKPGVAGDPAAIRVERIDRDASVRIGRAVGSGAGGRHGADFLDKARVAGAEIDAIKTQPRLRRGEAPRRIGLAATGVEDLGIARRHGQRADREGVFGSADGMPGIAAVGGPKDPALGSAGVQGQGVVEVLGDAAYTAADIARSHRRPGPQLGIGQRGQGVGERRLHDPDIDDNGRDAQFFQVRV